MRLLYLSYKFLYKNKFDSFTIYSSLMTRSNCTGGHRSIVSYYLTSNVTVSWNFNAVSGLVVWVLLFGTLGLQRLLRKTTQFQNFKNFKKIRNFYKTCSHYINLCWSLLSQKNQTFMNDWGNSIKMSTRQYLRIECILLKFHWGMKALTEVHLQWSALHGENVVRSTLSYPNETSKECIQFL